MSEFLYNWKATFDGGLEIKQFNEQGEVLFKEVEDKIDSLIYCEFNHIENNTSFKIDFITSQFIINNKPYIVVDLENPKLICKRRNKIRVDAIEGTTLDAVTVYILGFRDGDNEYYFEIFPGIGNKKPFYRYTTIIDGQKTSVDIGDYID